jgi:polysaccharide pyruvyl transferase WcaK-like protein
MKILCVDFWSDGNLGDAIMQREILDQCDSQKNEVHVISCFGRNQFQMNAFHESLKVPDVCWHPGFFSTYIKLDSYSELKFGGRITRLLKTLFSLILADLKLWLFRISGLAFFLGSSSYLKNLDFDVVVLNGRNYRDYNGKLKNYINNRPLTFHQSLVSFLFPDARILNAGVSIWGADPKTLDFIKSNWNSYSCNVSRESFSYSLFESYGVKALQRKDLSFSYLKSFTKDKQCVDKDKTLVFSLTEVSSVQHYLQQINIILSEYVSRGYEIILVDQVYLPHESIDALLPLLEVKYERVTTNSLANLIRVYSRAEIVISSRMHGSIIAMSQSCNVASIAYDTGAKWNIITDEVEGYNLFSPENLDAKNVIDYLDSDVAPVHCSILRKSISDCEERYVSEFIHNFSAKPE